jgi:hypothetical protein
MTSQEAIRLKIPDQKLDHCHFFELEINAVARWVDGLHKANLGDTARQLYQAIHELNSVRLPPQQRLELLEILRKPVYFASKALAKHYLGQPIVLPEKPAHAAQLADALHHQLAIGYSITAVHIVTNADSVTAQSPAQLLATALHRAISDYSINLVRHGQLYQAAPEGYWHQLHQFYHVAKAQKLLDIPQQDKHLGDCTIAEAYKRALLLGSCKANQLSQNHFTHLLEACSLWAKLVEFCDQEAGLLAVDLLADEPPTYKSQLATNVSQPLFINVQAIVSQLQSLLENSDALGLVSVGDNSLSIELIQHLHHYWKEQQHRKAKRIDTDNRIDLCVGLSATHHFIAGEVSFETLLDGQSANAICMEKENPFLQSDSSSGHRKKDIWDSPYEANVGNIDVSLESIQFGNGSVSEKKESTDNKYYRHNASTINFSATGYRIAWPKEIPAQLKPGEIVGLREAKNQRWSIATIRWVENDSAGSPQLGLELLCPSGTPYGARILHKKGDDTQFIRVLVLPSLPHIKQPYTLLTPKVPFKTGQKVVLSQQGRELVLQLKEQLNQQGNYCQFTFDKAMAPIGSKTKQASDSGEFDSFWDNL